MRPSLAGLRRRVETARAWAALARRLAAYTRGQRRRLAAALGMTAMLMFLRLVEPWPLKIVFDNVLMGQPLPRGLQPMADAVGGGRMALLSLLVLVILLVAVTSGFLYYQASILSAKVGQRIVTALRHDLYANVQRQSLAWHARRSTGDLIVRLIADIRLLREALVSLPMALAEQVLLVTGMAVVMLLMDWPLALAALALLPVLGLAVARFRTPMKTLVRQQRKQEGELADIAADSLGAMQAVQGFSLEPRELERFAGSNELSQRQGVKAARLEARLKWATDVAAGVVTALVVGVAAWRILAGALSPGDLIVFVAYMRAFARPLRRISKTSERIARTTAAGERVAEMLELVPEIRDRPDALPAPALTGAIQIDGVSFTHRHGALALDDVSLSIRSGERVGIVGPTGAGKTTLLGLVPRFHDPDAGRVRLDGHDVRRLQLETLRRQVSFVFQEPILFGTTVAANIEAGRLGASREEIEDAARRAGIHDVIASLSHGYDTVLGERGGTLSGGQRQCVAIARAMLRDAPIVLLDEPTTGLDARAAAQVIEATRSLMERRTVVMISHDLRRLKDMDRIVVLQHGRIVQEGTWQELAAEIGVFRELERVDGPGTGHGA